MLEDFGGFDGALDSSKGVLIGAGAAQVGILGTKMVAPKYGKYAGIVGAVLGGVASMLAMKHNPDAKLQGIAAALLVGVPRALEDTLLSSMLKGAELGAITSELGAVPGIDIQGPLEIMDAGAGSAGLIGAVTSEFADEAPEVAGAAFGHTF